MIIIGIDPGAKGAMCVLDGNIPRFIDFSLIKYIDELKLHTDVRACIEKVHAMPGQGVSSTFVFGQRLGELEGICLALGIPYSLVPPREWQKACGIQPKSDKKRIANDLIKLYPQAELYGTRGGLLDGRSDSLGIAHYARLQYNKE